MSDLMLNVKHNNYKEKDWSTVSLEGFWSLNVRKEEKGTRERPNLVHDCSYEKGLKVGDVTDMGEIQLVSLLCSMFSPSNLGKWED